jgi:glycosyltransferase involved in cell wall biosynthesis|tara:strand:- start:7973 stop:8911 length:939 start_codon:yes stop_codon:yes gene_type:complete
MTELISIVIPTFNEQGNVNALYRKLKSALNRNKYELIFVDDGSKDNTLSELNKLRKSDKRVKVISFTKNFKKASALAAGLKMASGKTIVTMDADLQDNPSEIPKLLGKLDQGFDIVIGWRYNRKDSFSKFLASKIFNFLVRTITRLKIHDCDCNFRAMRKEVVPHLELYSGLYRYIPVITFKKGFKVGEVKIKHSPRFSGKSKYGIARLPAGFFDLITIKFLTEYNKRPLHLFGGIGTLLLGLGFIAGLYLLYLKFILGLAIGQKPMLILTILLIFIGIQFVSIGLIGEMIANQREKNEYVIKEKHGFNRSN